MESLYLPILIAAAVALFIWSIATAIKGLANGEKRKLQNRLRDEAQSGSGGGGGSGGGAQLPLSITRDKNDAVGASALLARWSPLEGLHRAVVQAYPNMNVATFVIIALTSALTMFGCATMMTNNLIIAGVAAALGAYFPFLMLTQK